METDDNADVVNVLVTTGQLVPTLGKLLLFKLDGAFKATCKQTCSRCHCCIADTLLCLHELYAELCLLPQVLTKQTSCRMLALR